MPTWTCKACRTEGDSLSKDGIVGDGEAEQTGEKTSIVAADAPVASSAGSLQAGCPPIFCFAPAGGVHDPAVSLAMQFLHEIIKIY